MTHLLKKIVKTIKRAELTEEEEKTLDVLEKEIFIPTLTWSFFGFAIVFFFLTFDWRLIGKAMFILALYLVYGLFQFSRESKSLENAFKKQLETKKILFRTDMAKRIVNQFLVVAAVLIVFCLYWIIIEYSNGRFFDFTVRLLRLWNRISFEGKIDFFSVLFSCMISFIAVFMAIYRVSHMSDIIITDDGIFIGDSFFVWSDIKQYNIEYFFMRPVYLTIETKRTSLIRVQLSRFKFDRDKAGEIASIMERKINENSEHQKDAIGI